VLGRLIIGDTCIRGTLIFLVLYVYIWFSKQPCLTAHALFMATPFKGPVSYRMPRFNNAVKCLVSILIKYFKLLTYGLVSPGIKPEDRNLKTSNRTHLAQTSKPERVL
jgi:hypothetical protein